METLNLLRQTRLTKAGKYLETLPETTLKLLSCSGRVRVICNVNTIALGRFVSFAVNSLPSVGLVGCEQLNSALTLETYVNSQNVSHGQHLFLMAAAGSTCCGRTDSAALGP